MKARGKSVWVAGGGSEAFARMPTALLLLATVFLSGCSGYRSGSLPEGPPVTVYLEPVQNEAYVSGMAPLFQQKVNQLALQSRHLTLVSDKADAELSAYVRLKNFEERRVAFLEEDSGQAITSRVSLSALLTVTDTTSGRLLIENEALSAQAPVYSDPETAFSNPVNQTKPLLARNLASSVVLAIELAGRQRPVGDGGE